MQNAMRNESSARKGGNLLTGGVYPTLIRTLTGAVIITLCLWMGAGVTRMLLALKEVFVQSWSQVVEHMIVNALIMLALLEVIRTLQAYMKLGYVRVIFILDTALVVLIGEFMGLWFREYAPEKVLLGLGVIIVLAVLRVITARFSPEPREDEYLATVSFKKTQQ